MDKISEVFDSIKERVSNPLIFSFIFSWLIFNWRIPVALFWFDEKQISANGCSSIFEFIEDDWKRNGSIGWPLVFAIGYIIVIPFVKNGVRIVSAHAQKWGENEEIKALDGGKIGVEKYLKLKDDYKNATKKLEETIEDEKKYLTLNTDLLNEINDVKSHLNDTLVERNNLNDKIRRINDYSFLNGSWKVTTKTIDNVKEEVEIYIENGTIHSVNNKVRKPICQITDFYYDESNNRIIFLKDYYHYDKKLIRFNDRFKINRLNSYGKSMDKLSGFENYDEIEYVRYKY